LCIHIPVLPDPIINGSIYFSRLKRLSHGE
jgi:hypothetical protein